MPELWSFEFGEQAIIPARSAPIGFPILAPVLCALESEKNARRVQHGEVFRKARACLPGNLHLLGHKSCSRSVVTNHIWVAVKEVKAKLPEYGYT